MKPLINKKTESDASLLGQQNPSILSHSRALQTAAKKQKARYWNAEIAATVLAALGVFLPWPTVAAAAGLLSVVTKVLAKLIFTEAKKLFRLGERGRRYDFYSKTMGWPMPPSDRADMVIAQSSEEIRAAAEQFAAFDADYYAHKGAPSTERLLCNLCEVMFWTERLMGHIAKARYKQFATAAVVVVAILLGTILLQPTDGSIFPILKLVGSFVALLVALDVFGEARSFSRGEREIGRLLAAVIAEMQRTTLAHDEAVRLMVEYNCLLADLPPVPDGTYKKHKAVLNNAWKEFAVSLPLSCDVPPP